MLKFRVNISGKGLRYRAHLLGDVRNYNRPSIHKRPNDLENNGNYKPTSCTEFKKHRGN